MKLVRAVVLFAMFSLTASAQSQESPSQAPRVQTEQQPNGAAERDTQGAQKTDTARDQAPIVHPNAANNAKGKADRDTHHGAEDTGEYWPFSIFGAHLKITDSLLALFTFFLIVVGIGQGIFLYLTNRGTQKAAEAAYLNAQAVIDSERARLFVVMNGENVGGVLRSIAGVVIPPDMMDGSIPRLLISYSFKNFGKTPAIVRSISDGWFVATNLPENRNHRAIVDLPAHILGADDTTRPIDVPDLPQLTVRQSLSINGAETTFWFYGFITYDDTFGWRRTLNFAWHCGADSNGFRLFRWHETEERRPDDEG